MPRKRSLKKSIQKFKRSSRRSVQKFKRSSRRSVQKLKRSSRKSIQKFKRSPRKSYKKTRKTIKKSRKRFKKKIYQSGGAAEEEKELEELKQFISAAIQLGFHGEDEIYINELIRNLENYFVKNGVKNKAELEGRIRAIRVEKGKSIFPNMDNSLEDDQLIYSKLHEAVEIASFPPKMRVSLDKNSLVKCLRAAVLDNLNRAEEINNELLLEALGKEKVDREVKQLMRACRGLITHFQDDFDLNMIKRLLPSFGFEEYQIQALLETLTWVKAGAGKLTLDPGDDGAWLVDQPTAVAEKPVAAASANQTDAAALKQTEVGTLKGSEGVPTVQHSSTGDSAPVTSPSALESAAGQTDAVSGPELKDSSVNLITEKIRVGLGRRRTAVGSNQTSNVGQITASNDPTGELGNLQAAVQTEANKPATGAVATSEDVSTVQHSSTVDSTPTTPRLDEAAKGAAAVAAADPVETSVTDEGKPAEKEQSFIHDKRIMRKAVEANQLISQILLYLNK